MSPPSRNHDEPALPSVAGRRLLGALLIAEALLAFAPVAVLGPAFGWPRSLRDPASAQLLAIGARPADLSLGYSLYLLYSILIAPALIGLAARLLGGLHRPVAATVAAFAALSTLARAVGILRWLTVMPALARSYAGADPAGRLRIELVFDALSSYGGGIGELLGVSLFTAVALGLLCVAAWHSGTLPAWLALAGIGTALLLAAIAAPALGLPVEAPIAAATTALSLWLAAAGVFVARLGAGPGHDERRPGFNA